MVCIFHVKIPLATCSCVSEFNVNWICVAADNDCLIWPKHAETLQGRRPVSIALDLTAWPREQQRSCEGSDRNRVNLDWHGLPEIPKGLDYG